jgi:hypothetical protein
MNYLERMAESHRKDFLALWFDIVHYSVVIAQYLFLGNGH